MNELQRGSKRAEESCAFLVDALRLHLFSSYKVHMDITLSISQNDAAPGVYSPLNAAACLEVLLRFELAGTVATTLSSVDDRHGCWRSEAGVRIDVYNVSKDFVTDSLWPTLQNAFGLECAHVITKDGAFRGCIFDWLRTSACPAAIRKRVSSSRHS